MGEEEVGVLGQSLLRHLLTYRGHQVRFEADSHTTEFGICRSFPEIDVQDIRSALRSLELARWVYRRVQYVIGFSEPKLVFSLTPNGHRKAVDLANGVAASGPSTPAGAKMSGPMVAGNGPAGSPPGSPRRPMPEDTAP